MSCKEILAIIPARGGSKGIHRKNLANLAGHPLVAWSVVAAKTARRISRVVVSTDCPDIASVARKYGAEVPFLRPKNLSGDNARIGDAMKHLLRWLEDEEGYRPDAVAVLLSTHPFRTPELMDLLTMRLAEGYLRVQTVKAVCVHPMRFYVPDKNGGVAPMHRGRDSFVCYRNYGTFTGIYRLQDRCGSHYLHLLESPVARMDIDTPEDLAEANIMLKTGAFDARWMPTK